MKLKVNRNKLSHDVEFFLRRNFGYILINNRHTGKDSFVRTLTRNRYPRLHMYVKEQGETVIFDLHLDQKEPSYGGQHAHNAEYDGPVVESEIALLAQTLGVATSVSQSPQNSVNSNQVKKSLVEEQKAAVEQVGSGTYDKSAVPEKKGFWKKLFS